METGIEQDWDTSEAVWEPEGQADPGQAFEEGIQPEDTADFVPVGPAIPPEDPYLALAREYPGMECLPVEVIERIGRGEPPLSAYRAYENQQLKLALRMLDQDRERKARLAGSAGGEYGADSMDSVFAAFDAAMYD